MPAAADTTPTEEAQTQEQTEENKEVNPQEGESTETVDRYRDCDLLMPTANPVTRCMMEK